MIILWILVQQYMYFMVYAKEEADWAPHEAPKELKIKPKSVCVLVLNSATFFIILLGSFEKKCDIILHAFLVRFY